MTTLNTAHLLWSQAMATRAAEDWDVAADAWEEYDPGCGEGEIARSMAGLVRAGKVPRLVRGQDGKEIVIVHDGSVELHLDMGRRTHPDQKEKMT